MFACLCSLCNREAVEAQIAAKKEDAERADEEKGLLQKSNDEEEDEDIFESDEISFDEEEGEE